jgi:tetratricopeptide (TPR) repeat protein
MNANRVAPERCSPEIRNAIASGWMKRGIEMLNENTTGSLTGSLHCFDSAIELRRSLPLSEHPWYAYVLAAGWMNRGDALTRLGSPENLAEAVSSYDQALALLQILDLASDSRFRKRLALAWMNRGVTLQAQKTVSSVREALASFDRAIVLFRDPAVVDDSETRSILACGLTNRGNALLLVERAEPALARAAVEEALALIARIEQQEFSAAETALKARHILCRTLVHQLADHDTLSVSEDLVAAVTDAVDDAMKLAKSWEERGERRLRGLAEELFRFGARAYQIHQPHFLAEYLLENLDPRETSGAFPVDQELHSAASETIDSACARIRRDIFGTLNTPRFDRSLQTLRELRIAQSRLDELPR